VFATNKRLLKQRLRGGTGPHKLPQAHGGRKLPVPPQVNETSVQVRKPRHLHLHLHLHLASQFTSAGHEPTQPANSRQRQTRNASTRQFTSAGREPASPTLPDRFRPVG
jgi:hypothetical protein